MQKLLRYTTAVPYGYDILNLPQYVGSTDIKLVPVLRFNPTQMQLLLWTDTHSMMQYLSGQRYPTHHQIVKNLTDVSRAVGKIYCALKFTYGSVTSYGYVFHTPYTLPHYDTPIVGWTVNEAYVEEVPEGV